MSDRRTNVTERAFDAIPRVKKEHLREHRKQWIGSRRREPEREDEAMAPDWCDECGARHSPERRREIVRRMLPAAAREIAEEWPCIYPGYGQNSASARMLVRDLHAIGAFSLRDGHSTWGLLGPRDCYGCGHRHGGKAFGVCLEPGCDCITVIERQVAERAA